MTKLARILGLTIALGLSASASAQMLINGAGATFPYPIYSKWFDEYAKVDPSVRFNYQSIGSGGGQKQILAQTVDFGASDGPMSDDNLAKAPGENPAHSDRRGGGSHGLQPAWKSQSKAGWRHHRRNLSRRRLKNGTTQRSAALNPGVTLPDQDIVVVHRSDGSGTTFIFTDYLSKISPEWKTKRPEITRQ